MSIRAESMLTRRSYLHHFGPGKDADHYLYRCYDADGVLLYIGCTRDVKKRIGQHRSAKSTNKASRWLAVTMDRYETEGPIVGRERGRFRELFAIGQERPLFNLQGQGGRRQGAWLARAEDAARYLIERGHLELALADLCLCDHDARQVGAYREWCYPHVAAQVAGITRLRPEADVTDAEWEAAS